MIAIDVSIEAGQWNTEDQLRNLTETALAKTAELANIKLPPGAEIGVVFANDARVQELNSIWRQKDKPTNVLSFAANDGLPVHQWSPLLGDIVLAQETIACEAGDQKKTFDDHLVHLIIHGFLHLTGYDHETDTEAEAMEKLETRILAQLGIADPYA